MNVCLNETTKDEFAQGIEEGMKAMHALGVLHMDASSNNILWDEGRVCLIDFEQSTMREKMEEEHARKNTCEQTDEPTPPEGRGKSLWEDECKKELWSAVYTARNWPISVVYSLPWL